MWWWGLFLTMPDFHAFIRSHLRLEPAPAISEIQLYRGHAGSGLSHLGDTPPYWAYGWAGGTVLARYILDHPQTVAGRRVLDLGCGSGIVAIAAAKAGVAQVTAVDVDPYAVAATELNAGTNGVTLTAIHADLLGGPPPDVDLILGGDVFYSESLAARVTPFLDHCAASGIAVLIGDPGRNSLPLNRLQPLAEYDVPDFGAGVVRAQVFAFGDQGAGPLEPKVRQCH